MDLAELLTVETSVLRTLCLTVNSESSELKDRITENLIGEDFYFPITKSIFSAISDLAKSGVNVDPNSLEDPYDRERWVAKGHQDFYLPHGWRLKSEFQAVSDNAYPSDFRDLRDTRHDRFLTSNVFATKHFNESGDYGFVVSALYADDLQNPDDQEPDRKTSYRAASCLCHLPL